MIDSYFYYKIRNMLTTIRRMGDKKKYEEGMELWFATHLNFFMYGG